MPGENSISFKIYIAEGNENVEVRRFEVDQGVVTNYEYIRERLQFAFPRLRAKPFKILWRDTEGDEVTISSDEEMMIALSELESDLCKLIVRLPAKENSSDEDVLTSSLSFAGCCPALADSQANQSCSSCQKPIHGFSYKCLECVHYYQCSDCEHQAHHPDHVMLRMHHEYPTLVSLIPKGLNILKQHLVGGSRCAGMTSCLFGEPSHHEEHTKDKCGGHHRRRFRKHTRGNADKTPGQCEQSNDCHLTGHMFGNIGNAVGTFMNMYKNAMQQQQMETEDSSAQEDSATASGGFGDGPPEPVKIGKSSEEQKEEESNKADARDSSPIQLNPKIATALKLLVEMGFNDEGKWLSNLLERFDGDIYKVLDHLMLNK